jgi:hypothetical protein
LSHLPKGGIWMDAGQDRRRSPRLYVTLPATYEVLPPKNLDIPKPLAEVYERVHPNSEKAGDIQQGMVRDLSANGAFVTGPRVPLLSRILLKFPLPGMANIEAIGWVLWRRRQDCTIQQKSVDGKKTEPITLRAGFGILFEALPAKARRHIHRLARMNAATNNLRKTLQIRPPAKKAAAKPPPPPVTPDAGAETPPPAGQDDSGALQAEPPAPPQAEPPAPPQAEPPAPPQAEPPAPPQAEPPAPPQAEPPAPPQDAASETAEADDGSASSSDEEKTAAEPAAEEENPASLSESEETAEASNENDAKESADPEPPPPPPENENAKKKSTPPPPPTDDAPPDTTDSGQK